MPAHACQTGGLRENDVGKGAVSAAAGSGSAAEGVEEVDGEDDDAGAKDEDEDAGADDAEDEDANGRGDLEGEDVEKDAPPERGAPREGARAATKRGTRGAEAPCGRRTGGRGRGSNSMNGRAG